MRSHSPAETMRFVNHRFHLFISEINPGMQRSIFEVVPAIGIKFDPVSAIFNLFANRLPNVVGTINNLDALRHSQLPRVAEQRIHSRRRKSASRYEHSWPRNYAAIYGLFD